jgi:hypothetical protein
LRKCSPVIEGGGADYKYRTTIDGKAVAAQLARAVLSIDQTEGFNDSDELRAPYYLQIWQTLVNMQDALSARKWRQQIGQHIG